MQQEYKSILWKQTEFGVTNTSSVTSFANEDYAVRL